MDQHSADGVGQQPDREEAERIALERAAKKQKGKPGQKKQRHGANSWRQWIDEEEDT